MFSCGQFTTVSYDCSNISLYVRLYGGKYLVAAIAHHITPVIYEQKLFIILATEQNLSLPFSA